MQDNLRLNCPPQGCERAGPLRTPTTTAFQGGIARINLGLKQGLEQAAFEAVNRTTPDNGGNNRCVRECGLDHSQKAASGSLRQSASPGPSSGSFQLEEPQAPTSVLEAAAITLLSPERSP